MLRPLLWSCALAAALAVTPGAPAQDVKPAEGGRGAVHRMVIMNGASQTVHYFGEGISEGERVMLRDLERAENETAYLQDLQDLKSKYAAGEVGLIGHRQAVQDRLYGQTSTTTTYGGFGGTLGVGIGGYGYGGYGYPYYPLASAFPGPYYGGYGWGGYPASSQTTTVTRGLGEGVGPEGALDVALAQLITKQSTPEYAAMVEHNYQTALARAYNNSPAIRVALGGPKTGGGAILAGFGEEKKAPVTLTLKDGKTVSGMSMKTEGEWYVVDSAKETVRVRQSEVVRIDELKKAPKK
jgi:hypothetical protein